MVFVNLEKDTCEVHKLSKHCICMQNRTKKRTPRNLHKEKSSPKPAYAI